MTDQHCAEPGCPNCGARISGAWCSNCGQAIKTGPGTTRQALLEQWERIRHSVVGLLFRPGQLTAEFRDHQRARSIAPWRLAFNAVSFFLLLSFVTDFKPNSIVEMDTSGKLASIIESTVERTHLARDTVLERMEHRFNVFYTMLLTLSVGAYTLLVGVSHRKSRQPWSVHGVFALHYVAWGFLVSVALFGLVHLFRAVRVLSDAALQPTRTVLAGMALLVACAYLFVAFRKVYGDRPLAAIGKAIVIVALGTMVDGMVAGFAFGLTLASI
jgi:hypothetical protein